MLQPPNRAVGSLYILGYLGFTAHGVTVWLWPPSSLDPFVGGIAWAWASAAMIGGLAATLASLSTRARVLEASALGLLSYSTIVYLIGVVTATVSESTVGRLPQISLLAAVTLLLIARIFALLVSNYRQTSAISKLRNLERKLNGAPES